MSKTVFAGMTAIIVTAAGVAFLAWPEHAPTGQADPTNPRQVAQGMALYATHCASCHGADLAGETADWRTRKASGSLPAPPHDETGHTWHHPDAQLFAITRQGVKPFAPAGYVTEMQGYGDRLSDDQIWAVLAYIKSTWPADVLARQEMRNQASGG